MSALFSPKGIVILLLAGVCVATSILMLWSELQYTGNFPDWIAWLMGPLGVSNLFNELKASLGDPLVKQLQAAGAQAQLGDYGYALFMFVALCAAAVAIMIIGKEDSEEKTILPLKK
ncbi:MAG TPA: hypothetical protein V6D17_12235 [Candidatus Obscuribacterales bacterium]